MYGEPETKLPPATEGVVIRECLGEDMEIFVNLALKTGFVPEGDAKFWKEVARAEFSKWRCYVAYVDGEIAAHAALYITDRVGAFGFGATLEKFRGRGCQTALLHTRIADAAKAGCDLVISSANPGLISERNILRAGLRVAYTKAIWSAR